MFESLQSFNNSQVKLTPCFLCETYSYYVKTAEPLPLGSVTKLQSLLRGPLNRYRYIYDINCLPYSVACNTPLIVLTKTVPFLKRTKTKTKGNMIKTNIYAPKASTST